MGQIFQNFIAGNQAGREEGEARRRQNALEQAGSLYQAGDHEGAQNALIGVGDYQSAANMSALAESRRARGTRQAATDAVAQLGADATPEARMQAAAQATIGAGDFEQGGQLYNTYAQMNSHQREQVQQNLQFIGQQLPNLRAAPVEQRTALARSTIEGTPFDTPDLRAQLDRLDGGDGITDADLDSFEQTLLTFQERLGIQREDARYAVQDRQQERSFNLQERGLAIQARNSAPDNQRPLPPAALATARSSMAAATRLRTSYNSFLEMLRNASPQALAGVGPEGAALQSAHRLLAIQAKSPAALDLGALVGADFNILNDILGEPGNIRQLVQSGGREGALRRLEPFDQFLDAGAEGLRQTYQPWSAQMPEFYQDAATPAATDTPDVPAAPATRVTNASNYQRALAAFDAGPDTPERRAAFAQASGGTSVDEARIITSSLRRR
jgi:hypothetical protein